MLFEAWAASGSGGCRRQQLSPAAQFLAHHAMHTCRTRLWTCWPGKMRTPNETTTRKTRKTRRRRRRRRQEKVDKFLWQVRFQLSVREGTAWHTFDFLSYRNLVSALASLICSNSKSCFFRWMSVTLQTQRILPQDLHIYIYTYLFMVPPPQKSTFFMGKVGTIYLCFSFC